jgi:phosphatidylethanolamine-binding protein (PEBP) family uncharacterized protein
MQWVTLGKPKAPFKKVNFDRDREKREYISSKYSCDRDDILPQLSWKGVPADAKTIPFGN